MWAVDRFKRYGRLNGQANFFLGQSIGIDNKTVNAKTNLPRPQTAQNCGIGIYETNTFQLI